MVTVILPSLDKSRGATSGHVAISHIPSFLGTESSSKQKRINDVYMDEICSSLKARRDN